MKQRTKGDDQWFEEAIALKVECVNALIGDIYCQASGHENHKRCQKMMLALQTIKQSERLSSAYNLS